MTNTEKKTKQEWLQFLASQLSKISTEKDQIEFIKLIEQYQLEVYGFIPIEEPGLSPEEFEALIERDLRPDETD